MCVGVRVCLFPSLPPFDLCDFLPVGESEEGKKRRNERLSQGVTEMRGKGAIENLGERKMTAREEGDNSS